MKEGINDLDVGSEETAGTCSVEGGRERKLKARIRVMVERMRRFRKHLITDPEEIIGRSLSW